jgi:glycosyltransferase involved in cell wall biosynthesis
MTSALPKVSVIVPVRDGANFIGEAIASILAQNYPDLEILVVDDGSRDATAAILDELRARHAQLEVFRNDHHQGPAASRNTALSRASGQYIAFLDADDLWAPDYLATAIPLLETHRVIDVLFLNVDVADFEKKRPVSDWFSRKKFRKSLKTRSWDDRCLLICDDAYLGLLHENFVRLQAMILRAANCAGMRFDVRFGRSEDWDFVCRLAADGERKFAYCDVIAGTYRRYPGGLTSDTLANNIATVNDEIVFFSEYRKRPALGARSAARLRLTLCKHHLGNSYFYRKNGEISKALKFALLSLTYGFTKGQFGELAKIVAAPVLRRARRG